MLDEYNPYQGYDGIDHRFDELRAQNSRLRAELKKAEQRAETAEKKHKRATRLVAKYKPALEVYANEENWYECDSQTTGDPKRDFLVFKDGRDLAGYEIAQDALERAEQAATTTA